MTESAQSPSGPPPQGSEAADDAAGIRQVGASMRCRGVRSYLVFWPFGGI